MGLLMISSMQSKSGLLTLGGGWKAKECSLMDVIDGCNYLNQIRVARVECWCTTPKPVIWTAWNNLKSPFSGLLYNRKLIWRGLVLFLWGTRYQIGRQYFPFFPSMIFYDYLDSWWNVSTRQKRLTEWKNELVTAVFLITLYDTVS